MGSEHQEEGVEGRDTARDILASSQPVSSPLPAEFGQDRQAEGVAATPGVTERDLPCPIGSSPSPRATIADPARGSTSAAAPPQPPSQELFAVLVEEMKAYQGPGYVDVWKTTIQDLFADEFRRLPVRSSLLPVGRARYPQLRGKEIDCLLDLFKQVFVETKGSYSEWRRLSRTIGLELLGSKWAFTQIIRKLASQHKWAAAPVLNQWARVVRHGAGDGQAADTGVRRAVYEDFMFNPAKYSSEEVNTLRKLCTARERHASARRLREGTEDEWKAVIGIAEGHIACRRMPDFLRSIMDSKERLRLYSTIQAQVEGQLVLHIGRGRDVPVSRRTTRALTDMILESAELARVNVHAIHTLLGFTKTISYNLTSRSIHFYFFSRTVAAQQQTTQIPFQGRIYTLENVHRAVPGTIWQDQRGPDGRVGRARTEYTVVLSNLTRFHEIGRIAAFLKSKIAAEFDLEDLDSYTPNSRTSTAWRLTFQLAGCPAFLRGIVRLLWFGSTIIIRHPGVGRQLQCLRCGHLGHPAARCQLSDALLSDQGAVVATEAELQAVEDLAKPFSSPEEMRQMASQRLLVQRSADAAAQAAVTPEVVACTSPPSAANNQPDTPISAGQPAGAVTPDQPVVSRAPLASSRPERPWLSRPIRGRGRLYAHAAPSSTPPVRLHSGAFDVLRDEDDVQDDRGTPAAAVRVAAASPATEGSGAAIANQVRLPEARLTPEEIARKSGARRRGSAPVRTGPSLLAAQRAEREQLNRLVRQTTGRGAHAIPMEPRSEAVPHQLLELERLLGVRAVSTPTTGNCLAMALAQAVSDASLVSSDTHFEQLTSCAKRGTQTAGLLNLDDQFGHAQRVTALRTVGREWATMSRQESENALRWYLSDYASTPSDRDTLVPETCWGGGATLQMTATFVRRDVYVIQYNDGGGSTWTCLKYHPTQVTRHGRVVETATISSLDVMACVDDIQAAKMEHPGLPPLVLRLWGNKYHAYVHTELEFSSLNGTDRSATSIQRGRTGGGPPSLTRMQTESTSPAVPLQLTAGMGGESLSTTASVNTLVVRSQPSREIASSGAEASSLVVLPARSMILALGDTVLARKRGLASAAGSQDAGETAALGVSPPTTAKRGRIGRRQCQSLLDHNNDRIDRDDWPEVWHALRSTWPSAALTPYPSIAGGVEAWLNTAHRDPDLLLCHVRRFVFLSELMTSLDEQVLVRWTAVWRQDVLLAGLHAFRDRTTDSGTVTWIDRWVDSARHRANVSGLAPLIDNSDDWTRLRHLDYAADDVLRLCDPRRRVRLSQHLLCSALFDAEIAALHNDGKDLTLISEKLRSHISLLRGNSGYRTAYYSPQDTVVNWVTLVQYFSTALEPALPPIPLEY